MPYVGRVNKQIHVVQIGGLHFRFDKLRARRGFRGLASLVELLGAGAAVIVSGGTVNGVSASILTTAGGLSAVARLTLQSALATGNLGSPDAVERVANELLHFQSGEGTQISETGDDGSWVQIKGLGSLDAWESIGHMEVLDILRHAVEFNFFPTSAGPHTVAGTGPAAATTAAASSQPGASAGRPTSPQTGVVSG